MTPFDANFCSGTRAKSVKPGMGWKEITRAGTIYQVGNSREYETGDWRSIRPVYAKEKCIHCLICWRYCPDSSIIVTDGKFDSFDYDHCKGCGICANVCPADAIEMVSEDDSNDPKEGKKDE